MNNDNTTANTEVLLWERKALVQKDRAHSSTVAGISALCKFPQWVPPGGERNQLWEELRNQIRFQHQSPDTRINIFNVLIKYIEL